MLLRDFYILFLMFRILATFYHVFRLLIKILKVLILANVIGTWFFWGSHKSKSIFFAEHTHNSYIFLYRYIIYCWFSLPTKNKIQIQQSLIVMAPWSLGTLNGAVTEESPTRVVRCSYYFLLDRITWYNIHSLL